MKIKVKRTFLYGDEELEEGKIVDLPDSKAETAVKRGLGEKVEREESEALWEEMEKKLDREPEKPKSNWLTADEVSEGDEIVIAGTGRWDDTFADDEDRDLVIPVECEGEKYDWRVNKTNLSRIVDAFGTDTGEWVGEKIVVDEIVDYSNLGTRGFKVSPVAGEE